VELILEERQKEEERWQRPVALIEEMDDLLTSFQEKHSELKERMPSDDGPSSDQVEELADLVNSFEVEHKTFSDELKDFSKTKAAEMLVAGLPSAIKSRWAETIKKLSSTSQEAALDIAMARASLKRIQEAAKKELIAAQLAIYKRKLKESPGHEAFNNAEKAVRVAEEKVEPFIRPKGRTQEEMQSLEKDVKSAAEAATALVTQARGQIHLKVEETDLEGSVKSEIEAFVKKETNYYAIRFGQFGQRIQRCHNLLQCYRNDLRKAQILKAVAELKPKMLEQVQQLDSTTRLDEINSAMKSAEQEVELSKKSVKVEEMEQRYEKITEQVESIKASVESFRQKLCPVEVDAEEDVKKTLRAIIASEMKSVDQKLVFQEKRLALLERLTANFRDQIDKKKASKLVFTRQAALNITNFVRQAGRQGGDKLSTEDLFDLFDKNQDGLVDKDEFLQFFAEADSKTLKKPSQEDLQELFESKGDESLDWPAFRRVFATFMKVLRVTNLTDERIVKVGEAIRELALGEELEVLSGPTFEPSIKVNRVKVSAEDGVIGWATVASNVGTVFLKEVPP